MTLRKEEAAGSVAPQPVAKERPAESGVSSTLAADAIAPGRAGFASNAASAPSAKSVQGAMLEAPEAAKRVLTPEKELERIAELRRVGRDAEADEALARFKREHPDYRIADDVWEKVRPR